MANLSAPTVDFDAFVAQFMADLPNRTDAWRDLVASGTGQTLLEWIAGIGTLNQFTLTRAVQEAFPDTAKLPSSVRAWARGLGVNPRRRISARGQATLVLDEVFPSGSVTIPALSTFVIGGMNFYNPEELTFPAAQSTHTDVSLEQGSITVEQFIGSGLNWQAYQLVPKGFIINENLMSVKVNGSSYQRERISLFQYTSADKVFLELTRPDGSVLIVFPDALHGAVPQPGDIIEVTYALSEGLLGNNAAISLPVSLTTQVSEPLPNVGSVGLDPAMSLTTTALASGAAEEDADALRYTGPGRFAANQRTITRRDYRSIIVGNPFVDLADARIWGEREIYDEVVETAVTAEAHGNTAAADAVYDHLGNFALLQPVAKPGSVVFTANYRKTGPVQVAEVFTDNGSGVLVSSITGLPAGYVNYLDGTWLFGLANTPVGGGTTTITASYVNVQYRESPNAQRMNIVNAAVLRRSDLRVQDAVAVPGNGTAGPYVLSTTLPPLQPGSVTARDSGNEETFTDNGGGVLVSSLGTAGSSLVYSTGLLNIQFHRVIAIGETVTFTVGYSIDHLTPQERTELYRYLAGERPTDGYKHVSTAVRLLPVEAVVIDITADLYVRPGAPMSAVQSAAQAAVTDLFLRKFGVLGFSRPVSDIYNAFQDVRVNDVEWVDYVNLQQILVNGTPLDLDVDKAITIEKTQYPALRTTVLNVYSSPRANA